MTDLTISANQALEPHDTPDSADALDAAEEEPEAPASDDGTTTEEVPAGYVSDAELLAWLQAKSTGQYGELDELMDLSNARSKLVKDLTHLKDTLIEAEPAPEKVLAELQEIRAAYAGTEYDGELEKLLGPLETRLEAQLASLDAIDGTLGDGAPSDRNEVSLLEPSERARFAVELKGFTSPIDATIKDLEHDDQLALVQIQALMSDIRETSQLTSNIIANRSQTSDSIVGNLRA